MKQKKILPVLLMSFLCVLFIHLNTLDTAAAANKVMRMTVQFPARKSRETDADWNRKGHLISIRLPGKTKLNKNMYMSARLVIPASLFKNDGDNIGFSLGLDLENAKDGEYTAGISTRYLVYLSLNDSALVLDKLNLETQKFETVGREVSVRQAGKNFVVTLNKIPMGKMYTDAASNKELKLSKLLAKKKKYTLVPYVLFLGDMAKKTAKEYVYIDEVKIRTSKLQKVTFSSKKEYQSYRTYRLDNKDISGKIIKMKVQ